MIKWSRLFSFLLIVVLFFALAIPTYKGIWKNIQLGLDLKGGFDVLYQVGGPNDKVTSSGMQATVALLEERIFAKGITDPSISIEGSNRIRVQLAGVTNQYQAKQILVQSANLEFKAPDGKTVLATGRDIMSNAHYEPDPQTGGNDVAIQFKDPKKFQEITTKYLGQPVGIYLDGKLLQAPNINTTIYNGQAVITGQPSAKAATDLANYLNAGALPYPMTELSSMAVSATLGAAALHDTLIAGLVAFALILIFMLIVYRLPGLVAMIALVMYAYLLFAVVSFLHITLTLPGLAALILGVGMAVDVNIIAAERIKDEFRNGKSLLSATIMGQKRSLPTIIDANVTSIIAGLLMYYFGTGSVKSFALVHIISVLATFLTAVLISRGMLQLLVRSNLVKNTWWYGAPRSIAKTASVPVKGGARK